MSLHDQYDHVTTNGQGENDHFLTKGIYLQEDKANRVTVKIDSDIVDKLFEESVRIRKTEGKKPSYSEVLRRIYAVYVDAGAGIKDRAVQPPASADPLTETRSNEERRLVAAFLLLLRDRSELATTPREAILTLLSFWLKKIPGTLHNNGQKSA